MQRQEQWRDIQGWPKHEVSNQGRVRRKLDVERMPGHMLSRHERRDGYVYVVFRRLVHHLVADAFLGVPSVHGQVVNHKNGDKGDNCAGNLEWVTPSDNQVHAYESGLQKRGTEHGRAKLTNEEVLDIRERYTGAWGQQSALAKEYGVSQGLISQIVKGEAWAHLPMGKVAYSELDRRGANHPFASVTDDVVRAVKADYAAGGITYRELAAKYGISRTTVSRIVRGQIWKHIT